MMQELMSKLENDLDGNKFPEINFIGHRDIISEIKELITWFIGILNTFLGMYLLYRNQIKNKSK